MSGFAYYDGSFGRREDIRIPLSNRSIFFGDAVYDAAIGEGGKIFQLEEHVERFLGNCAYLGYSPVPSFDELTGLLLEAVRRAGLESYFLYFQLSRALTERRHSAADVNETGLLITVDEFTLPSPDKRLKLILAEDKRYGYCNVKTVNLLPNVLYSTEAERRGADEAVLHRCGTVTECAHSNVSILKDGALITHPTDSRILPGITRATLLGLCRSLNIPCIERGFTKEELFFADEVLITSTSKLCLAAESIDGIPVGGGAPRLTEEICHRMQEKYRNFFG